MNDEKNGCRSHGAAVCMCVSCQHISFGKMTLLFRLLDSLAGKRQCRCHFNGDSIWAEVSTGGLA